MRSSTNPDAASTFAKKMNVRTKTIGFQQNSAFVRQSDTDTVSKHQITAMLQ